MLFMTTHAHSMIDGTHRRGFYPYTSCHLQVGPPIWPIFTGAVTSPRVFPFLVSRPEYPSTYSIYRPVPARLPLSSFPAHPGRDAHRGSPEQSRAP
jgi:hypothetical protein